MIHNLLPLIVLICLNQWLYKNLTINKICILAQGIASKERCMGRSSDRHEFIFKRSWSDEKHFPNEYEIRNFPEMSLKIGKISISNISVTKSNLRITRYCCHRLVLRFRPEHFGQQNTNDAEYGEYEYSPQKFSYNVSNTNRASTG